MTTDEIKQLVVQAAVACGIDPTVALAQIHQESGFNPSVTSYAGAQGLAQFTPGTWAQFGSGSPFDPPSAMSAWCAYMSYLLGLFNGDIAKALAGYNAGQGNVQKAVAACGDNWLNCLPTSAANRAQTINYVNSILAAAPGYASYVASVGGGDGSTPTDTGGGDTGAGSDIAGLASVGSMSALWIALAAIALVFFWTINGKAVRNFPSVGDLVYYQLPDGSPNAGLPRPAVIITVHDNLMGAPCDLVIFNNGVDDLPGQPAAAPMRGVVHDEFGSKGTWQFIPEGQHSGILH